MIIRVGLLLGLAVTALYVIRRRHRFPGHLILVLAILGLAAAAVLFPDITQLAAGWAGVGRGADLVNYLVEMSLLFIVIHYYTKFVRVDEGLTTIIRELALLRAELESRPESSDSEAGDAESRPAKLD